MPESYKNVLLTTREAANILRRGEQTLRLWACKKNGPISPVSYKKRSPLLWKLTDIEELMAAENPQSAEDLIKDKITEATRQVQIHNSTGDEPKVLNWLRIKAELQRRLQAERPAVVNYKEDNLKLMEKIDVLVTEIVHLKALNNQVLKWKAAHRKWDELFKDYRKTYKPDMTEF